MNNVVGNEIENVEALPVDPDVDPYEAEALEFGWKPADQWEGEGHIPAEKFMTRGAGLSRKLTKQNEELAESVAKLEKGQEVLEASVTERVARTEKALKAAHEAKLASEIERIQKGKYEAVELGDTEAYAALDKEEKDLSAPKDDAPEKGNELPKADQEMVDAWAKDNNAWFTVDKAMTITAIDAYDASNAAGETVDQSLAAAKAAVEKRFPSEFKKDPPPAIVDEASLGLSKNTGGKSWSDIPKEEQQAARSFIEDGTFDALAKDRKVTPEEAFAQNYWSE